MTNAGLWREAVERERDVAARAESLILLIATRGGIVCFSSRPSASLLLDRAFFRFLSAPTTTATIATTNGEWGDERPWPLLVSMGGEPRGYIPAASVTHSVDRCRIVYLISTAINQESRSHPEAAERCVRPINERL